MASKYDWEFIRPLDQTANIAALSQGNQQINAGLQGIAGAVTGYADAMKQRNTDEIMNALYQAQTSADLPQAMQAVQALQQQHGRGYDQNAVRNAIDTRGSTLGQRDLQNINLQQAQAAQAAIPQLNQAAITQAQARGVDTSAMQALANLGVDTTGQINSYANNAVSDTRDTRDFNYRKSVSDRDYNRQVANDLEQIRQWEAGNTRANMDSAYRYSEAFAQPATSGFITNPDGTISQVTSGGVSRGDAFSALMGSIFNTESNNTHRDRNGNLTRSSAGALGVAQIMPATASKPGYGMKPINLHTTSAEEQKAWATEYIGRIAKQHNFTTEQAVAAYNAGAGKVQTAIKEGGSNWLSKLPKETQNYVPKVMGGAARQASNAIGPSVSQAAMSKVTSVHQDALAKLEADFSAQSAKDQVKGSLASTGKNVDTWAASNRGKDSTWFTSASDLAAMAKKDPAFNRLPENAQINVLNGAFSKMNDVNAFQYVPDGDLKKFISSESQNYQKNRVAQHTQAKNALFEQTYQNTVQAFQAAGSQPPTRDAVRQMLNPQYKAPTSKQTAIPYKTQSSTQAVTKAVTPAPKKETQMEKNLREREARKKAEWAVVEKRLASEGKLKPKSAPVVKNKGVLLPSGNTKMTQEELDKLIKKFK